MPGLSVFSQPPQVATSREAAASAETVLLAVPYPAVDATNPFALSSDGRIVSSLPGDMTAGTRMASLLPGSIVIRAFTHSMEELLVSRGTTQAGLWAMAMAGDD